MEKTRRHGPRLRGKFRALARRLYLFLCAIHLLGGRLRMGRPLRLKRSANGGDARCTSAAATAGERRAMDVGGGDGSHRSQLRRSTCVADVLAAAGNLPDGNAGASNICESTSVQKYCGI